MLPGSENFSSSLASLGVVVPVTGSGTAGGGLRFPRGQAGDTRHRR
ncbi:MAG TPA: hypothetical protein VMV07_24760 [Streptosporangiaceae bacterium]|nr:hypothetical protein [Streptosporangiaceae bacterium]